MKNKKFTSILFTLLSFFMGVGLNTVSLAATPSGGALTTDITINRTCQNIDCILLKVSKLGGNLLWLAGGLSIVFIIIGGIRYMVSAGNSTQTEGAKKTIIYALIGLVIVILSATIVGVISAFLK